MNSVEFLSTLGIEVEEAVDAPTIFALLQENNIAYEAYGMSGVHVRDKNGAMAIIEVL